MGGPAAGQWSYTDLAGTEVFRIVRLQTAEGKTFRPIHRTADGWHVDDPPGLRPLFGLPALAGASRAFITEGEKAAEAIGRLPGIVATTSAHGAKSPAWTDWSPLAGKEVVVGDKAAASESDGSFHIAGPLRRLAARGSSVHYTSHGVD